MSEEKLKYCEGFPGCGYQDYDKDGHLICESPRLCVNQSDKPVEEGEQLAGM